MSKYKLHIAYEGTHYSGWQVQPNSISVQSLIEQSLQKITQELQLKIFGAGRTDAGVHALEQVAHFTSNKTFDPRKLAYSLNGLLPKDIRITTLVKAPDHFHARYSATGKIYRYHLDIRKKPSPFHRLYSYRFPHPINTQLLIDAAQSCTGTRNFSSFSNELHSGSAARNPIRTMSRIDIVENTGELILEFEADGFLYKMVRNLTGTLLDIARGKIPIENLPGIFAAKDRRKAGAAVPPHGLFLTKVLYKQK